jgi:hypothetical protein
MTIMKAVAPITAALLTGVIPINAMQDRVVNIYTGDEYYIRSRGQPLFRGRGLSVNIRNKHQENVMISYRYLTNGIERWTQTAELVPPGDIVNDEFGGDISAGDAVPYAVNLYYNMDMLQTPLAGNVFMAGANHHDGTALNSGAVYVYSGEWSKWSHQQTLTLSTQKENDFFGTSIAINQADLTNAAITCLGCDPLFTNSSATYIYSSEAPLHNRWSQQQVLVPLDKDVYHLGYGLALQGSTMVISGTTRGDSIIAKDIPASVGFQTSIYVYHRPPGTQHWTELQKLDGTSSYSNAFMVQVEDETIGISDGRSGIYLAGHLKIYYPDTPRYREKSKGANSLIEDRSELNANFILNDAEKPRPRAPQWSLQQVLYDPVTFNGTDGGFGSFFSFHGNSMVVARPLQPFYTEQGRQLYIYERPSLSGQWSLQQYFTGFPLGEAYPDGNEFFPMTWYGPTIIVGDTENIVRMYSTATEWSCLVISLEDVFGDGWGDASMHATAPDGSLDIYRHYCDSPNPLAFRYCPLDGDDRGLYSFTIQDAMKAKFPWEIQWRIFEEKTGKWYRGNDHTRMDFYWEPTTRDFTARGIIGNVPLNISCVNNCKSKPTPKPTPEEPHRALKSSPKTFTHAPSVSPAPTLGQTSNTVWEYFTMTGSGWFDESHHGTNYYISDINGKRLVSTGTKCDTFTSQNCWQSLPDGEYILRVSGYLNKDGDNHAWAFCGRQGTTKNMLVFSVTDGQCDALEFYTRSTFCLNILKTSAAADVTFLLHGVNEFTLQDQRDLTLSLSFIFPEVAQEDIHVVAAIPSSENLILEVTFGVPVTAFGYDPEDPTSISLTYDAFMSKLSGFVESSHLREAMATTSGMSALASLTSVEVVENHISLYEVLPTLEEEVVTTFTPDEEPVAYSESKPSAYSLSNMESLTEKIAIYSGAGAGYLIFGTLILVTLFFIQGKARSLYTQSAVNDDDKEMVPQDIMTTAEKDKAAMSFGLRVRDNLSSLERNLVSFFDDVGDVVVDFIAPPEEEYQAPTPTA